MDWVPSPRAVPRRGDDTPASSLARYVWRMSGGHQIAAGALGLVVATLTMVPLELQRRIVNGAIGRADAELLAWLGLVYLAVVVVSASLKFALRLYQSWLSESAILHTRAHLARLHHTRREDGDDGRAIAIIDKEVDDLGGFVGEGPSAVVVNGGMLVAIGAYMLVVEPLVAAVGFLVLAPQTIVVPWLQRCVNRRLATRTTLLRELDDRLAEGGGRDGEPQTRLQHHLRRVFDNRMGIYGYKYGMKFATNLFTNIAPLTVLVVGGVMVLQDRATVGVVVAFLSGLQRLEDPMRELLNTYRTSAQARVRHDMIARWL